MIVRMLSTRNMVLICGILLTFLALPSLAASLTRTNSTHITIPDAASQNYGEWVNSPITITSAPADAVITGMDVTFTCTHARSSDLDIDLNDENIDRNYDLWRNEGGNASNPSRTITGITTFNGMPVNQTWYLYVQDCKAGNTGYISSWTITIYYEVPLDKPFIYDAVIQNVSNVKDIDNDGYLEDFQFAFAIDADYPGSSGNVAAKIICTTTGQRWSTKTWTITGEISDFMNFQYSYADFAPFLTGQTSLQFQIELWNPGFTEKYDTITVTTGAPIKAEPAIIPRIREAQIAELTGTEDADGDGYYENYSFKIKVDADYSAGATTVAAKVLCSTTGQEWSIAPWTINGTQVDWNSIQLSQADFVGKISGPTNLNFIVILYDPTFTTQYGIADTIIGAPLKVESASGTAISGTVLAADGTPMAGVIMNGLPGSPVTAQNGTYRADVPSGWSGTVAPYRQGCIFTPASRTYSDVTSDRDLQDYTGSMVLGAVKKKFSDFTDIIVDNLSVTEVFPTCVYVETEDRSAGIRVDTTDSFNIGDVVRASGMLVTDEMTGERYIFGFSTILTKISETPRVLVPLAMSQKTLGGDVMGLQAGIEESSGINNIGLLVTVWGKVSHIDADFFYLDDGSGVDDGSGWPGVKCSTIGHDVPTLTEDQFFYYRGVSCCYKDAGGKIRRLIR